MKTISHLLFIILFVGCSSPQKLVDNYEYKKALKVSTKRLKKGKAKWHNLNAFEQSFNALTEADSIHVQALRSEGRSDVWPEIYEKAVAISNRQSKVQPVLNKLYDTEMEPVVHLYPADELKEEAAEKSAVYYYTAAMEYLERARDGDRYAARDAYTSLDKCRYYLPNYKDAATLQEEMLALGATHILLFPIGESDDLPFEFDLLDKIIGNQQFPFRQDWQVFHLNAETIEGEPHYLAEIRLYGLYVSSNDSYVDRCRNTIEVVVGQKTEKVWNESDSTWLEQTVDIYEEVSVSVKTITQEKSASLNLSYSVVDVESSKEVHHKKFFGCENWENTFSRVIGDTRALFGACSDRGGYEERFPSDNMLLLEAAEDIRYRFYKQLRYALD